MKKNEIIWMKYALYLFVAVLSQFFGSNIRFTVFFFEPLMFEMVQLSPKGV